MHRHLGTYVGFQAHCENIYIFGKDFRCIAESSRLGDSFFFQQQQQQVASTCFKT